MWLIYTILYVGIAVVWSFFYGALTQKMKEIGPTTVIMQGTGGILMLLLVPFFHLRVSDSYLTWGLLLFSCAFYALNDYLQTEVRAVLSEAEATLIFQLSVVVLIFAGVVFFHTDLSDSGLLGTCLILAGSGLVLLEEKKTETNERTKAKRQGFIAAAAFGTALAIDAGISEQFNLPLFVAITLFGPAGIIKVVKKITWEQIKIELTQGAHPLLYVMTGVLFGCMILCSLLALQSGPVPIVASLSATIAFWNALILYFIKKQRDRVLINVCGSLLVIVGVYLTTPV